MEYNQIIAFIQERMEINDPCILMSCPDNVLVITLPVIPDLFISSWIMMAARDSGESSSCHKNVVKVGRVSVEVLS
jgi:hypothetical protein